MTKTPETIWAAEMAVRLSEMQAERDAAIARAEKAEVATRKWQSIGDQFGISKRTAGRIVNGESYV